MNELVALNLKIKLPHNYNNQSKFIINFTYNVLYHIKLIIQYYCNGMIGIIHGNLKYSLDTPKAGVW